MSSIDEAGKPADEETSADDDDLSTIRENRKTNGGDFEDGEDDWLEQGDYDSRIEELLSDDEEIGDGTRMSNELEEGEEEDEDEAFVYTGTDANTSQDSYRNQLRDVLDDEVESDADGEISNRLSAENDSMDGINLPRFTVVHASVLNGEQRETSFSDLSVSTSSIPQSMSSPSRITSPRPNATPTKAFRPPFLHPSISRLRSTMPNPQQSRRASESSLLTASMLETARETASPSSPSHVSALSRQSSTSNLRATVSQSSKNERERDAIRWTALRVIGDQIFTKRPDKAQAILGVPAHGTPTVLAANGMVCVGTDAGRVIVFDFKQNYKCTCGDETSARLFGPVSALALSHDHTFVAVGHARGHIQLFDFKNPQAPARSVPPTTLAAVASGRQEGHIYGSRIVALGFVAGRHTAIVSADDQGLAFYHSLGKVLFVDATDVLRILGKYPEKDILPPPSHSSPQKRPGTVNGSAAHKDQNGSTTHLVPSSLPPSLRKAATILSMAPLPLGTAVHATDIYHLVALLTPIKLVIIGLKPSPKTWFRRHREGEDGDGKKSRFCGCLAWFPSIIISTSSSANVTTSEVEKRAKKDPMPMSAPLLAFTWGRTLTVLKVFETRLTQKVMNKRTGKTEKIESGKVNFDEQGVFSFDQDILAIQWLNANQLILFSEMNLEVIDVRAMQIVETVAFNASELISPLLSHTQSGQVTYQDALRDVQHSVKAYKGKVFTLGYNEIRVGALLTWADKILSFVQNGDFISAISLTRDYYLGQARGNMNGLPEDPQALRSVVGEKMSELMVASARYAFSEDRLTDATHVTADNRGVDRTSLFEGLVNTCARACIALEDFEFLFEELFHWYDHSGISGIYLQQLEPFVLDGSIAFVPPRITKRLIEMYEVNGELEDAERIIWHINPACLDIDQAINLCQNHGLYDALIYVYNTALQDFITPLVLLLNFVRVMQQRRRATERANELDESLPFDIRDDERLTQNAYRIYNYISNVLSGLTYPSGTRLDYDESLKAMDDIYEFLFYGRSKVWPVGDGGKLVLTADEEGGPEPTYPYARLLLCFDAEAFLHTLDVAFEESYLNDSQVISRQIIVKILMEIVSSSAPRLTSSDETFVHIFVARNVPTYPQFVHISPSALETLLLGLASDTDQSTREDRQLASEFLLSAYTPRDSEQIMQLFEDAGFYRILRSWYRSEKQWSPLIRTFLHDEELMPEELFPDIESALAEATRAAKGVLPREIINTILDSLSQLLDVSIPLTALLINKYSPADHCRVVEGFPKETDYKKFAYLRCLLGPPAGDDIVTLKPNDPATRLEPSLRKQYLTLLCQYDPSGAIEAIDYLPEAFLPNEEIVEICEKAGIYDVVVWLLSRTSVIESLEKLESCSMALTSEMSNALLSMDVSESPPASRRILQNLRDLYHRGITICRETSQKDLAAEVPLEDLWFKLLSSQIDAVHTISATSWIDGLSTADSQQEAISVLRETVQESFTSLVSVSSTKAVSFPRLFKRLVDSSAHSRVTAGTPYNEFRTILTSMLESYRSEGDMLVMSKRILENDFFEVMETLAKERSKGWMPRSARCATCRKQLQVVPEVHGVQGGRDDNSPTPSIVVSRTGLIYHSTCVSSTNSET